MESIAPPVVSTRPRPGESFVVELAVAVTCEVSRADHAGQALRTCGAALLGASFYVRQGLRSNGPRL